MSTVKEKEKEKANNKASLKLLVDTRDNKVVFAEAGKDFVDFLFHILSLPIGTITRLVNTLPDGDMVGCLGDLYKSIQALSIECFESNDATKDLVLNPTTPACPPNFPLLKVDSDSAFLNSNTCTNTFYACPTSKFALGKDPTSTSPFFSSASAILGGSSSSASEFSGSSLLFGGHSPSAFGCPKSHYFESSSSRGMSSSFSGSATRDCDWVSSKEGTVCPGCDRVMSREMKLVTPKTLNSDGYVKGGVNIKYMVLDNLEVKMSSPISTIAIINKKGRDLASLVEEHVEVGYDEGVKILKASLETQAVLTTVFLERGNLFQGTAPNAV